MNTETLQTIRQKLEVRRERLLAADDADFYGCLMRAWSFLHSGPVLKGILSMLEQGKDSALVAAAVEMVTKGSPDDWYRAETDLHQATIAYHLLALATSPAEATMRNRREFAFFGRNRVETQTRLVVPLFDFLLEALDEQQVTLGCLIRYAQRCEWFDRANLAEKVAEVKDSDADYKQVEKLLQFDLYRYLHDQGVNFVIEPYSVRGEIDLIVDQRGGDRHFIETKVFDNRDKGKKYLRSGFHQLATYLGQYRAPVGYLAIYKLCQESLQFEADGQAGNVLFVTNEGRTIYLLVIDLYQHDKSVSQRRSLKVVRITRDELAKPVDSASPSPDEVGS